MHVFALLNIVWDMAKDTGQSVKTTSWDSMQKNDQTLQEGTQETIGNLYS